MSAVKMCAKCGNKPACVKSPRLPALCFECGTGKLRDQTEVARRKRVKAGKAKPIAAGSVFYTGGK